jgi:hypothetical protein
MKKSALLLFSVTLAANSALAQNKSKYVCAEPSPAQLCNAGNTCGSPSAPCEVDVKRTNYGASATPQIPGAKANAVFCVRSGTQVNWKSTSKSTGFVVDMGPASPFHRDAIIGGSDKAVTATAVTAGCYKYSVGACVSGALNGMCANGTGEFIVVAP